MRYFRKAFVLYGLVLATLLAITAFAEAPSWVQWLPGASPAMSALYRMVPSLGGNVAVRRPPKETVSQLALLSSRTPSDAELIRATAREYEAQLDFKNAEDRWELLDSVSPDRVGNQIELADYYHRRLQPNQELLALTEAENRLPAVDNPIQPETGQRAWKLHERGQQLIQAQAMPAALAIQDYESWIAKYPNGSQLQLRFFNFLLDAGMIPRATQVLTQYEQRFPNDKTGLVRARTRLAEKRGAPGGAIAVYDAAYDPLSPDALMNGYFTLLTDSHKAFDFYQSARRAAIARPLDLNPATRLFHYYRHQSDINAARRELAEFRMRKEGGKSSWTVAELNTLARLSDSTGDYDEAIRYWYALYSLTGADNGSVENALAGIINVLLKAPDQPIRFGLGDLSFYHDIATIDSSPGFLNGILSLIFNSQSPDSQFRSQDQKSRAYFHRAKAAELYALLTTRFPTSTRRSELLSRLIESYALYGEDDAIIRQGTAFTAEFPDAPQRTRVALQVADAYARRRQVTEELAVYNRLLAELAARAQQVPLGGGQPRSPEYAQVLQRYISRLSQLNRITDALAIYRAEIDRNPNDPGLYDGLAAFLGANQRSGEIEQVYRRAMQRFQDPSWRHKLARFYLRSRMSGELQTLSHEVVDTFKGSEVEAYIGDVVADSALERRLQIEINVYALNRFPRDLRFVHNLISLYSSPPTVDPAALMRLLSEHWYDDESLRRMYFERLAGTGTLAPAVQSASSLIPAASLTSWDSAEATNPAVTRFLAEAAAWQSHFESASTIMRAVATAYPADPLFAARASELYRSLAAYDPSYATIAATIAEDLSRAEPRSRQRLTRIGEIYADRDMFSPASAAWVRIPTIEPGKPEGYLETATVFWDYVRPAEALSWLRRGRTQLKDTSLWTYEAGAILESQNQRQAAVTEYVRGALSGKSNASQARLLRLATRQDYKTLVDAETKRRADAAPADQNLLQLRVSVLRAQKRDAEVEPLLQGIVARTTSREMLSYVRNVAVEGSMRPLQERVLRRDVQLETDPKEKLRLGLELAHLLEAGNDLTAAQSQIAALYQANPLISGVIRATADYYWRHDKPAAVRVLVAASEKAHASLKREYLIEIVHKGVEAKQFSEAIQAADQLLRIDPIDGVAVALMADVLAASGRQTELQKLYSDKIAEIQQAKLSTAEKTDRTATLRRGWIPVLTRDGKFTEAIDQYIEIVNKFPDDTVLLGEAGRYATQHNLRPRLTAYYTRTSDGSPKDPRWFIVLARLQTQFENYPAAIDAYTKAMNARPERQDLAIARADLEERTFQFPAAIATYNRLYELSHKSPIWLELVARLQARLGQNQEAVSSLRRAYIDNRPEATREYVRVATILEEVGLVTNAGDFIRQAAGAGSSQSNWIIPYARILTRLRAYDEVMPRVLALQNQGAAGEMGRTAAAYFTPEERQAFAQRLTAARQAAPQNQRQTFIEIADAARLYDLEVSWSIEQRLQPAGPDGRFGPGRGFENLQEQRMRFTELARQLEDLASKSSPTLRIGLLSEAMRIYQVIGDTTAELQLMAGNNELQVNQRGRYYELLAQLRPDQLLAIAGRPATDNSNLQATQALIAAGDQTRALQAIPRQGRGPLWTDTYTGLTGLYFGSNAPEVSSAFQRALGPLLIQDRLSTPLDRSKQLAGDIWFYYGQRYADYLRDLRQTQGSDDYLWSELDSQPGDPEAYLRMARYYRQAGVSDRAVSEFGHVLELKPKRVDVRSEMALVLWDTGRRPEALAEWKASLDAMTKEPTLPGESVIRDIRSKQQESALRAEIDAALRAVARTLQVWQLPSLLQAAFEKSTDNQWLLDVIQTSRAPVQLMTSLMSVDSTMNWMSTEQQRLVLENAVRLLSGAVGPNRYQYQQVRQQYLQFLLDHNNASEARKALDSFSDSEKRFPNVRLAELRIAAIENKLTDLLATYAQNPAEAPEDWILQQSAAEFERLRMPAAGRQVREFLFTRQIENSLNPTAFLGLAEIRVRQGQLVQATELLKRLNQISPAPFDNLLPSARVFSSSGHPAEAEPFLKLRVQAAPWDHEARLELARVEVELNRRDVAGPDLQRLVTSRDVPYDIRTLAAREQARGATPSGTTGSRELDLLSNRTGLTPDNADGAFFFAARTVAAEQTTDPATRVRLLLAAVAERPDDAEVRRRLFTRAIETRQYRLALAVYLRGNVRGALDSETAAGLAMAHEELGEFDAAARFYKQAAVMEREPAKRPALEEKAKQAQAAWSRVLDNERRRPVMKAELDQPTVVQRRLP